MRSVDFSALSVQQATKVTGLNPNCLIRLLWLFLLRTTDSYIRKLCGESHTPGRSCSLGLQRLHGGRWREHYAASTGQHAMSGQSSGTRYEEPVGWEGASGLAARTHLFFSASTIPLGTWPFSSSCSRRKKSAAIASWPPGPNGV